ncbi:uncharacterized protein [Euphorbia lathyris]|uniref:uncharacterized protein n=1 Tax=Euphorbia lathyris TaxID=212925 RepID=UPI003313A68B
MAHPRNVRAASSSCSNVNGASSSHGNTQANLHSIQERLDGFNAERADFIVHLERINERQQRADERQQRMDQTLQSLHLRVDVDEVNQLRGGLMDIETQIGPSVRQIQTILDRLHALERLDRDSNN